MAHVKFMGKILDKLKTMPAWLSVFIGLLMVAAIGYVDYITGDYSILIFYAIPIVMAAWKLRDWGAIIMSVASGCSRYVSDYNTYSNGNVRYWNSIEDTLFLLIVGLLVSAVKRLVDEENSPNSK